MMIEVFISHDGPLDRRHRSEEAVRVCGASFRSSRRKMVNHLKQTLLLRGKPPLGSPTIIRLLSVGMFRRRCKRLRTCSGLLVLVRWQPHPTQQVSVAGVGADVPETRVSAEEDQPTSALLISHFEELKRLRFLAHNATGLS